MRSAAPAGASVGGIPPNLAAGARPVTGLPLPSGARHARGPSPEENTPTAEAGLPITDPVYQFTVLVLAALVAERVAERARLPGLLGLLVLGTLLGPGLSGVLPREPMVDFLGHVGLVYVMFMAGAEIDLGTARAHVREALTFGLLAFAASLLPTTAVALLVLDYDPVAALLLGTVISSHTLLAYPIIERLGLLRRTAVVTAVAGTLLTDTLALVLLAVVISTAGGGTEGIAPDVPLGWAVPLGLLGVLAAVSLWGVPRLSRAFFRLPGVRRAEKALFALVVLLVLSTAAEAVGTDAVLGAFLAGVCLNQSLAEREDLQEHVEFVGRMLFIPFFFVYTGMLLEPDQVASSDVLTLAGALLLLVLIGKSAAAWITGAIFDYSSRERVLIAGLTVPQAAATLAVTITAQEAGILDQRVVDAVVLLIFVTCIVGPLLTGRVGRPLASQTGGDERAASGEEDARQRPVRRGM